MNESLSKFMVESAKRHDENSNLINEIQAAMDAAIRNQGASIKSLEIQIEQIDKVLQERGFGSLPGSTETNLRDHVKSISTTVEADTPSIRRIDPSRYAVSSPQNKTQIFKPNRLVVPFSSRLIDDSYDEMDVLDSATYLKKTLNEDQKMGYQTEIINERERLGLRERMDLDLEARLIGETLILNRSLNPDFGDFIELNDLNEPLEIWRNQVEDLGPMVEEGEVIDKPMVDIIETMNDNGMIEEINEYLSFCDHDRKIHVVMENMDAYRHDEIGDVIVGKPFLEKFVSRQSGLME
ncbi:hypothetical protein Tco_0848255 [Tanacetum coccineum]